MRDSETRDVKDMLLSGKTKEELIKALEDEIASAQNEIEKEQAAAQKQREADAEMAALRKDLISLAVKYMDKLGIIDATAFDDEDYSELEGYLHELEQEWTPHVKILSLLKGETKDKEARKAKAAINADEIIERFLKNL